MKKSVILILVLVVVVLIVGVSLFFGLQVNLEKARDIALDRVSDEKAEIIEEKSEKEFLLSEYEFTILTEDARYEITVGSFGDINGFEKEELPKQSTQSTEQNNTQNNTTDIGIQKAHDIPLTNHADEIEVTEGLTEYDYTIYGNDGTIIRTTQDSVHD